jgi:hypothetical protein
MTMAIGVCETDLGPSYKQIWDQATNRSGTKLQTDLRPGSNAPTTNKMNKEKKWKYNGKQKSKDFNDNKNHNSKANGICFSAFIALFTCVYVSVYMHVCAFE